MKTDPVKLIISLVICALISFGLYQLCEVDPQRIWVLCCSFLFLSVTSCFTLGFSLTSRGSIMLKTLSGIFFLVGILFHLLFALFVFNQTLFLIADGLLLLVYLLVAQSIYKAKQ